MEQYKRKVLMRIVWLSAMIAAFIAVYLTLLFMGERLPADTDQMQKFAAGVFTPLTIFVVYYVIKNVKVLRNEEALREQYVRENDERARLILQKTGSLGFRIAGAGLGLAAIVACFLDKTVFFSLLGALAFIALIKLSLKLYYGKKY